MKTTMRTTYEQIKYPAQKTLKCACCNKLVKRQTTFMQTINPFNTNDNGDIKSREEIWKELNDEAVRWKKMPILCGKCNDDLYNRKRSGDLSGCIFRLEHCNFGIRTNSYGVCVKRENNYWFAEIEDIENMDFSKSDYVFEPNGNGHIFDKSAFSSHYGFFVNGRLVFFYEPKVQF